MIEKYRAWSEGLAAAGKMVDGHKLADEGGRAITRRGGETTVTDGPYVEAREVVGGLFVVEADGYDEAARSPAGPAPGARVDRAAGGGPHLSVDGARVHGLVDHLFRREAGRMVAALCRVFGPHNLELAEDVVQEALVRALREWPFRGVPDDPRAWLAQVAHNRALDLLRRDATWPARRRCSPRRRRTRAPARTCSSARRWRTTSCA